jgi:uncharacterized protein involved in response to NO
LTGQQSASGAEADRARPASAGVTGSVRSPIPRLRARSGLAILNYGFRPFFFLAGLWSALGMVVWLAEMAGIFSVPSVFPPLTWHAHEMLFGFTVAAIAGFLLTAIPNWTGRLPLHGRPLLMLVLFWLGGRLAVATSAAIGAWAAAVLDLAFLAALLFVVAREIVAGKNWRNLPMLAAIGALLAANALMHCEPLNLGTFGTTGWRLAIAVATLLIALVGGRIVPSFTRNWLAKRPSGGMPAAFARFDQITLAVTVIALVCWIALPGTGAASASLAIAAVLNLTRLCRWRGYRTVSDPLVWILHVGYAWVAFGLGLLALAQFPELLPESAAVHGLTAGAIGTMTLAVMTRAIRGHTGRPLRADYGTTAVYVLVTVSALSRITASIWPGLYDSLLWIAGAAWIAAFSGFLLLYGPMLLAPRIDGKPG